MAAWHESRRKRMSWRRWLLVVIVSLVLSVQFTPTGHTATNPLHTKPTAVGYQTAFGHVYKCRYWALGGTQTVPKRIVQDCRRFHQAGAVLSRGHAVDPA